MFGCGREEELVSDGVGESDDLDTIGFAQVLLCDCASCYSSCVVLAPVQLFHVS